VRARLLLLPARPDLVLVDAGADPDAPGASVSANNCFQRKKKEDKLSKLVVQPEDPHRRRYKCVLSTAFLLVTALNLGLDIAYQVWKEALRFRCLSRFHPL